MNKLPTCGCGVRIAAGSRCPVCGCLDVPCSLCFAWISTHGAELLLVHERLKVLYERA